MGKSVFKSDIYAFIYVRDHYSAYIQRIATTIVTKQTAQLKYSKDLTRHS